MHLPIPLATDTVTFVTEQSAENDLIFSTKNHNTPFQDNLFITNDKDYQKPDRTQYIFTTMGKDLIAVYSNNMATPIRQKTSLGGYNMYNILAKQVAKKEIENGVYIVDYYRLTNDGTTAIEAVIDYYVNTDNIQYSKNIVDDIVRKITTRQGRYIPPEITIRIVTFIPESAINSDGYVYVETSDIMIAKGGLNNAISHPNSKSYRNNSSRSVAANNNVITIEVVNNNETIPYYIKVGNTVETVFPTRDHSRPNGVTMSVAKNGSNIVTTECKLTEAVDVIGLHGSKEAALTAGNVSKLAEIKKLELEKEKIAMEYEKIKHDKEKLKNEKEMLEIKYQHEINGIVLKYKASELDITKKYVDMELSYKKMILDMQITFHKHNEENKRNREKHRHDMNKSTYDASIKFVGAALNIAAKTLVNR